ncbi:hypothetical protein ACTFIV_002914 [Dictyostelium citrinum]
MRVIVKFIIIVLFLSNIFNIAISERDSINSIIQNNHNKLLESNKNNNNKNNNNDNDDSIIKKEIKEEKEKNSEELLDDFKITRGKTPNGETITFDDSQDASNYQENGCKIIETCRKCLESEESEPYCSKTNHRIKMFCEDNESIRYISCKILNNKKTKNNYNNHNNDNKNNNNNNHNHNNNPKIEKSSAINIIYFEVVVLVVFVFSIYFVKERKRITKGIVQINYTNKTIKQYQKSYHSKVKEAGDDHDQDGDYDNKR